MHSTLPSAIHVAILPDGARYRLPARPEFAAWGLVTIGGGIGASVLALMWGVQAFLQVDTLPLLVQLAFALATVPVALLAIACGLWMIAGYDTVEVAGGCLKAGRNFSHYGWTRSRKVAGLRRLSVAVFRARTAAPSCTLYAESDHGVPLTLATGYTQEVLTPLAHHVAQTCQQPQRTGGATAIPVAVVELDALRSFYWRRPYAKAAAGGWLMLLAGSLLIAIAAPQWASDQASRKWPSVIGQITQSEIVTTQRPKDASRPHDPTTRYVAKVAYHYAVAGQAFEGSRLHYGVGDDEHKDRKFPDAVVARYPVGKDLPVYYSPRSPKVSVLEPGKGAFGAIFVMSMGGVLFLSGLVFVGCYACRLCSPRHHILYQHGLAYDVQHPPGIGALLGSFLKSEWTLFVLLLVPLVLLVAVAIGGLLFLLM